MLENIFLMNLITEENGNEINPNNFSDAYLAYPDEDVLFDSNEIVRQIIISQKSILEKSPTQRSEITAHTLKPSNFMTIKPRIGFGLIWVRIS